jgi:uncharacterized protein
MGKTSLVNRVSEILGSQEPDLKICHIDLFNVRTEQDFYIALAGEILKATSTKWEEQLQNAKYFLSRLLPRISFSPDAQSEIIDISADRIDLQDPVYKYWLSKKYFRM